MSAYRFDEQHKLGERFELACARALRERGYLVRSAHQSEQRIGIDLVLVGRDGRTRAVECKADLKTRKTGNVFVELVADVHTEAMGWARRPHADFLILYVGTERALIIPPLRIRARLADYERAYPVAQCVNEGELGNGKWTSSGVLVPLHELERIATGSLNVGRFMSWETQSARAPSSTS